MAEQSRSDGRDQAYRYAEPAPYAPPWDQQPLYEGPYGGGHTSKRAVWSTVVGVIGLFFFGPILGVVAVGLAVSARRAMRAAPGHLRGAGWATAGLVLGWIDIALWVIGIAVAIAVYR